jgi:sugar/nucleoside kinase (ribokinase family)
MDVVGVGALNLDYLIRPRMPGGAVLQAVRAATGRPIDVGTEQVIDRRALLAGIEAARGEHVVTSLGGSAFNAICALARTRIPLRLGFVAVAGRLPHLGRSALEHLRTLGVDTSHVWSDDERLAGVCLSYLDGPDRTMFIHIGANATMARYLQQHDDALVGYLSSAKVVHLSSFLDDSTAGPLSDLLRRVKATGSPTRLCFDPGHVWSGDSSQAVRDIVNLSDYLLVNEREFDAITARGDTESRTGAAARLLGRSREPAAMIMLKQPTGITTFRIEAGEPVVDVVSHRPLPAQDIVDSTGAGDVFAAGVLADLGRTGDCAATVVSGIELGLRLARHKLVHVADAGARDFADIARSIMERRR